MHDLVRFIVVRAPFVTEVKVVFFSELHIPTPNSTTGAAHGRR